MSAKTVPWAITNFALFGVVFCAVYLVGAWFRAAPLVQAGLVTRSEVKTFLWGAFAVVGGSSAGLWMVQALTNTHDMNCLNLFPPRSTAAIALWIMQAAVSGVTLWWLWARNGDDVLARLAPVFTRGPVLERTYDRSRVRLVVSALAVLAPVGNVIMHLIRPAASSICSPI